MKEKISSEQIFCLVIAIIIPTIILWVPAVEVGLAQEAAWITVIVAGIVGLVLQYIILKLGCGFSNKSMVEDVKDIFGPVLGRMMIFPYLSMIIYDTTTLLNQLIEFIEFFMPRSFIIGIWIGITLLIVYFVYAGIENIARVALLTSSLLIMVILIVMLLNYPNYEDRLKSILIDFNQIFKGSIYAFSWFILPSIVLLFLKPFFKDNNKAIKSSLLGSLFSQLLITILIVVCILVFDINLLSILSYPFYSLGTLIIEGLGVIIFVAWISGNIVKISLYYFISIKSIAEWFELNRWKKIIIPFSIMILAISIFKSQVPIIKFLNTNYYVVGYLVIQIPILLIISIGYLLSSKN